MKIMIPAIHQYDERYMANSQYRIPVTIPPISEAIKALTKAVSMPTINFAVNMMMNVTTSQLIRHIKTDARICMILPHPQGASVPPVLLFLHL